MNNVKSVNLELISFYYNIKRIYFCHYLIMVKKDIINVYRNKVEL